MRFKLALSTKIDQYINQDIYHNRGCINRYFFNSLYFLAADHTGGFQVIVQVGAVLSQKSTAGVKICFHLLVDMGVLVGVCLLARKETCPDLGGRGQ